jgi:ABC-2 type transport system ATP-binding protein
VRLLDPDDRDRAEGMLTATLGEAHRESDPTALSAPCSDADRAAGVLARMSQEGIGIADFSMGQPSLDEVFLALTGRPAEESADPDATREEAAA